MRPAAILCLLALAGLAAATPPVPGGLAVEGKTVVLVTELPFRVVAPAGAKLYFWRLPHAWKGTAPLSSRVAIVAVAPEGTATVEVDAVGADFTVKTYRLDIGVGKITPPTPPTPPVPPGPVPPPPGPSPIPEPGFRVLIVYESADLAKMPAAQQMVLFSKSVRDYLNSKCVTGADGKTKEWRIWDKDVDATGEAARWRAALARPRASVPWLLISTGTGGYEGPLPPDATATLALLKKYGGE